MGKFAIRCPNCNNYTIAYNGLRGLIQNKITCKGCGKEIDVKTERMTSVQCPTCGNMVVYDQGKKVPTCPVCHGEISPQPGLRMIQFKCPECGVGLSASEGTKDYICPICDNHIDVQREAAKDAYGRSGAVSLIKYEGDNRTLVWKHPIEDFNAGSQLIVHESQEAIFFRGGQALDTFTSVGSPHTLDAMGLVSSDNVYQLPTPDTRATFHAEVYFVNLTNSDTAKWGTPDKVKIFDQKAGFYVNIGASGTFNLRVTNSRKLVQTLVGTANGLILDDRQEGSDKSRFSSKIPKFVKFFRELIVDKVSTYLATTITERGISVLDIAQYAKPFGEELKESISTWLEAEYGLTLPNFVIERFATPESDPSDPAHKAWMDFQKTFQISSVGVRQAEAEAAVAQAQQKKEFIQAQTAAQKKIIAAQGEAGARKAQVDVDIYRMRGMGYTYQDETQRQVSLAGMKALEQGLAAGGDSGGMAGDGAGLMGGLAATSMALGAMGGIMGTFKDTVGDVLSQGSQAAQSIVTPGMARQPGVSDQGETWDCPNCGTKGLSGDWQFCPKCRTERPAPAETWDCPNCGTKGLSGDWQFCPKCRTERPAPAETWDCPNCGTKGLSGDWQFCPKCRTERPAPVKTWDCPKCGTKGLSPDWQFCPKCQTERPDPHAGPKTWDCAFCGTKGLSADWEICPKCRHQKGEQPT